MRINISARDAIAAALEEVNGRAKSHVLESWHVESLSERAESDLESRGVPKKSRQGVRVTYSPAGPGKAYSRKARSVIGTSVTLERGAAAWFLIACSKVDTWATASETYVLTLPDETRAAVIAHALRNVAPA